MIYRRYQDRMIYYPIQQNLQPLLSITYEVVIETEADGTWRANKNYWGYFYFVVEWFNFSLLPNGITITVTSPFDWQKNETITLPWGWGGPIKFWAQLNASNLLHGRLDLYSALIAKNGTFGEYSPWVGMFREDIGTSLDISPICLTITTEEDRLPTVKEIEEFIDSIETLLTEKMSKIIASEVTTQALLSIIIVALLLQPIIIWLLLQKSYKKH